MFSSGNVLPVKIQPALLRPMAYRVLSKKFGLNIKSDGLAALAEFIGANFGMEWKKSSETLLFLEQFAGVWKQQERGLFIDSKGAVDVISELRERQKAKLRKEVPAKTSRKNLTTLDNYLKTNVNEAENNPEIVGVMEVDEKMILDANSPNEVEGNDDETDFEDQLDWKDYFKIINASQQQKFTYDHEKLQFVFKPNQKSINEDDQPDFSTFKFPDINSKLSLFSTRYYIIKDRVMRNESFQNVDSFNPLSSMISMKNALQNNNNTVIENMPLTLIKNLLGRDGKNFLLLGLLHKNSKGSWSLEDPSGMIEINIFQTIPTPGLYYVSGCLVLAEGIYYSSTDTFHVTSMTHPPGERRDKTLESIGNIDFLGVHAASNAKFISKFDTDLKIRLHYLERELVDHKFVILGADIFLDDSNTLAALKKIFMQLNEEPPIVIVFQGSFSSTPVHASIITKNINFTTRYKNGFDSLATLISQFENLARNSTLIFVPGINDPWSSMSTLGASGLWPQNPITSFFTGKMNRICKHIVWGSNPMRIAYLAQEIVIMRDEVCERLKRNSVTFPIIEEERQQEILLQQEREQLQQLDDNSIAMETLIIDHNHVPVKVQETRKIVKTILDQGHLSPFTSDIRPIVWDLDHVLTLHPIPTTLILSDTSAPEFDITYNSCKAFNPGRFLQNRKAKYVEYLPSMKQVVQQEIFI